MLALISDAKTYKIKNTILYPFVLIGLATGFLSEGIDGVIRSLLAAVLPVLALIILYFLRMLGAGDIKLFSAIGAIMGIKFVLYAMAYSFLSGGVIALVIMGLRKNGLERLKHLLNYIKTCFITFSIHPYTDFENKTDGAKFPFSYAVACGTLISALLL